MSDTAAARAREQRIAEIRERESKATKVPWFFESHGDPQIEVLVSGDVPDEEREALHAPVLMRGYELGEAEIDANWEFVQHARADIPFLLEQLAAQSAAPVEEVARACAEQVALRKASYLREAEAKLWQPTFEAILRQHGYGAQGQGVGLKEHVQHVQQFLNDLWAFSIDPLHEGMKGLKVAEVCEMLLKAAKDNRDEVYKLDGLFRIACKWVWKGLDAPGQTLQSTIEAMKQEYDQDQLASPVPSPESATPLHGICPNCGADRSGPSAEAHAANCPESATKEP